MNIITILDISTIINLIEREIIRRNWSLNDYEKVRDKELILQSIKNLEELLEKIKSTKNGLDSNDISFKLHLEPIRYEFMLECSPQLCEN